MTTTMSEKTMKGVVLPGNSTVAFRNSRFPRQDMGRFWCR